MQKVTSARFPWFFAGSFALSCVLLAPLAPFVFVVLWALWRLTLQWHEKNS
jgi:hypothetical protein